MSSGTLSPAGRTKVDTAVTAALERCAADGCRITDRPPVMARTGRDA